MYRVACRRIDSGLDEEVVVFQREIITFRSNGRKLGRGNSKGNNSSTGPISIHRFFIGLIIYTIAAIEIQNKHQA